MIPHSLHIKENVWSYDEKYDIFSYTVRAEIFAVVLFSWISRVKPSRKFMSIYSNDNISKLAKLTPRELPHLAKTAKIMAYTVVSIFVSSFNRKYLKSIKLDISVFEFNLCQGVHTNSSV